MRRIAAYSLRRRSRPWATKIRAEGGGPCSRYAASRSCSGAFQASASRITHCPHPYLHPIAGHGHGPMDVGPVHRRPDGLDGLECRGRGTPERIHGAPGDTASRNTGVLLVALPWWATLSTVLCRSVPSPRRIASVNASISPVSNMLVAPYASRATTEFAWTSELEPTISGSRGLSTAAAVPSPRSSL